MASWVALDALQLWDKNYNHNDTSRFKKSFREFGFNGAIRLWRDNVVIGGNHSTLALRELRAEGWRPSGGGVRIENGAWEVLAVDTSHLDRARAEAFALVDNHLPRVARPDLKAQVELMEGIAAEDERLLEVVFTADELAEFDELSRLADGLAADLESAPGEGKRVGLERAKQVRVVVSISELQTFEAALLKTGEVNRGDALLLVCKAYLNGKK